MINKIKNVIPLNWGVIGNPINWVIVILMIALASVGLALIVQSTTATLTEEE